MRDSLLQFLRFCIVGVGNTTLTFLVILVTMNLLGAHPVPANVLGYAAGLCLSFYANGRWTFKQSLSGAAGVRFFVAFALCYAANLIMLLVCLSYTTLDPIYAQLVAMVTYTSLFFLLNKVYVFGKK